MIRKKDMIPGAIIEYTAKEHAYSHINHDGTVSLHQGVDAVDAFVCLPSSDPNQRKNVSVAKGDRLEVIDFSPKQKFQDRYYPILKLKHIPTNEIGYIVFGTLWHCADKVEHL